MHDNVEARPARAELCEQRRNLGVVLYVAGERCGRAALRREFFDAPAQALVLIGKGEFGALAPHHARYAPGDGAVAGDPGNQRAFSFQQFHAGVSLHAAPPIIADGGSAATARIGHI